MSHPTPRLFILRHGETEWSLSGKHTGTSDIPLTANGESRSAATGAALVGEDRLIARSNLAAVYVSPRRRAQRTLELVMGGEGSVVFVGEGERDGYGREEEGCEVKDGVVKARITGDVAEWDYGEYEGRTSKDIREERERENKGSWEIWRDGCPGGESPQQITDRLDRFIAHIRKVHHAPAFAHLADDRHPPRCDVVVVAHGHILRALAARWVNRDVRDNPNLLLEAGGVGCLSYEHHSLDEPAILLGGAFVVNVAESAEEDGKEKEKLREQKAR